MRCQNRWRVQFCYGVTEPPVKRWGRKKHHGWPMCGGINVACSMLLPQVGEWPSDTSCEVGRRTKLGRHPPPMLQHRLVGLSSISPIGSWWGYTWALVPLCHNAKLRGQEEVRERESKKQEEKRQRQRQRGERLYAAMLTRMTSFLIAFLLICT